MEVFDRASSTQSAYIQSVQTAGFGTVAQPRSSQANQLGLLLLASGLILALALAFYGWRKQQISRRSTRSKRDSAAIDWYQAEFGCSPPTADATGSVPPDSPAPTATAQLSSKANLDSNSESEEELPSVPQEPHTVSLSNRYSAFIQQTIADTLKGKIRSKDYVFDQLVKQLQSGTSEIFERCLKKKGRRQKAEGRREEL